MGSNNREERALLSRLEAMGIAPPTYRNAAGLSLWVVDNLPPLCPDDPRLAETVELARNLLARYGWANITLTEKIELLSAPDQERMLRDILQEMEVLPPNAAFNLSDLIEWTINELPHMAPNDSYTYVAVRLAKRLRKRRPVTKRHARK